MEGFDAGMYGARYAQNYDEWHSWFMDTEGAVEGLAALAGDGPVLDLGAGTGRLAVPLVERGLAVHAIEISPEMVAQLLAKPGGDRVEVVVGDMTTATAPGEFTLAYVGHNTIVALPDQRAQVRLFANAAAHLRPGGRFALESQVRRRVDWDDTSSTRVLAVGPDQVRYQVSLWDPVTSVMSANLVELTPDGPRFHPLSGRMVTHAEMDLMAELAGLELEERWADWKRAPFTADARMHVSVYRKPA
jgi:SAM-dependent methyltransferase